MRRTTSILTAATIFTLCAVGAACAAEHTTESLAAVKQQVDSGKAVLVDVREHLHLGQVGRARAHRDQAAAERERAAGPENLPSTEC